MLASTGSSERSSLLDFHLVITEEFLGQSIAKGVPD